MIKRLLFMLGKEAYGDERVRVEWEAGLGRLDLLIMRFPSPVLIELKKGGNIRTIVECFRQIRSKGYQFSIDKSSPPNNMILLLGVVFGLELIRNNSHWFGLYVTRSFEFRGFIHPDGMDNDTIDFLSNNCRMALLGNIGAV